MQDFQFNIISQDDIPEILILSHCLGTRSWAHSDYLEVISSSNMHGLIIKLESKMIAFVIYTVTVDEMEILQIVVHPEYQGQQIGSRIMRFLFESCREKSLKKIYLEVASSNNSAIAFYNKFGFKDVHIRHKYYFNGDSAIIKEIVLQ
jgi:ribosomal-protein-alanine N-acetyltransferase